MLKNIVNESLLFALQDGRDALRWDDLWQAKLTEEIGLKQPVKYSQREKEMVAVHEAAHAVTSYALERGELQIQVITIQKRESALGLVSRQPLEETYLATQKQILADIQISLAGLVAERIWFGQTTSGPSSDLQAATSRAAAYVGVFGMGRSLISATLDADAMETAIAATLSDPKRREEVDQILDDGRDRVHALLERKRHVVEGVRDALLDREELVGDEALALLRRGGPRRELDRDVQRGVARRVLPHLEHELAGEPVARRRPLQRDRDGVGEHVRAVVGHGEVAAPEHPRERQRARGAAAGAAGPRRRFRDLGVTTKIVAGVSLAVLVGVVVGVLGAQGASSAAGRVDALQQENVRGTQLADEMRYQFLMGRFAATNSTYVPARKQEYAAQREEARTALKEAAAEPGENLMPHLLDAARVHATEGEIIAALQSVWGDYTETPVF
jgi:hypothetical protein